jgi:hypothetical protein
MLGAGTGSEIRQPLGYAIVGGLLVSQLLTLFTTPVVYIYMDRVSGWLDGRFRSQSPNLAGICQQYQQPTGLMGPDARDRIEIAGAAPHWVRQVPTRNTGRCHSVS